MKVAFRRQALATSGIALSLFLVGASGQAQETAASAAPAASAPAPAASASELSPQEIQALKELDAARKIRLDAGMAAFTAHRFAESERQLSALVTEIEADPRKPDTDYYCAQSQAETLLYLLEAANSKRNAVVLLPMLCNAMFGKAFSLVELRRYPEALATLQRLVKLAPHNALYLIEYGQLLARLKQPEQALPLMRKAEEEAKLAPDGSRSILTASAMRGQGYVLVELGRLDEAEAAYRKSLTVMPDHRGALAEIEYIQGRRSGKIKP